MKLIICIVVLAVASAEPVQYRSNYASAKNTDSDVEIQQVEVIEIPWQEDTQAPPQDSYGPPQPPKQEYGPPQPPKQEYGPPKPVYGPPPKPVYGPPPEEGTTTEIELTTTELPTTTETINNSNETITDFANLKKADLTERGSYYVYHPNGVLQRVVYATKDDAKNMAFSAQLKYQNVEPINGPIYTYDPETYVLRRISK